MRTIKKIYLKLVLLVILCYYINKSEAGTKLINNKSETSDSETEEKLNSDESAFDENVSENSLTIEENSSTENKNKTHPIIINMNTSDFKHKILQVIEDVVKHNLPNLNITNENNNTKNKASKQTKISKKINRVNDKERKIIKTNDTLYSKEDFSRNLYNKTIIKRLDKLMNEVKDIFAENKMDNASTIYPFAACVLKKGSYLTHGALLTNQWVVTAAFDLFNVRESIKIYTVRLGSMNCKKGDKYPLKSIQIHPFFVKGLPDFDLAMLNIAYPVIFKPNIRPIPISSENMRPIFAITYSRKGSFEADKLKWNSKQMNLCELEKYSWDKCKKWLKNFRVVLNETSRCVRPETRCQGWRPHLSAPLISREGLVGIISGFQPKPSIKKDPVIFTALSTTPVRDWIDNLLLRR